MDTSTSTCAPAAAEWWTTVTGKWLSEALRRCGFLCHVVQDDPNGRASVPITDECGNLLTFVWLRPLMNVDANALDEPLLKISCTFFSGYVRDQVIRLRIYEMGMAMIGAHGNPQDREKVLEDSKLELTYYFRLSLNTLLVLPDSELEDTITKIVCSLILAGQACENCLTLQAVSVVGVAH